MIGGTWQNDGMEEKTRLRRPMGRFKFHEFALSVRGVKDAESRNL